MRNSNLLSFISVVLLVLFIIMAIGSEFTAEGLAGLYVTLEYAIVIIAYRIGPAKPIYQNTITNATQIIAMHLAYQDTITAATQISESTLDSYGRLHGVKEASIGIGMSESLEEIDVTGFHTITGLYEHGMRHGWHEYYDPDVSLYQTIYYEQGRRVTEPDQNKPVMHYSVSQSNVLSYDILLHESPWFMFKMLAYGVEPDQIEDFLSSLQSRLIFYAPWSESEFTNAFRDAVEDVRANDTLTVRYYEFISALEGLLHLRNFELRLAVVDRYFGKGESTYEIIQEYYPGFLEQLLAFLNEDAVKSFTDDLDERMDNEEPVDFEDPAHIQIIDERMVAIVNEMFESSDHLYTLLVIQTMITDMVFEANPVHEALKAAYFTTSVDDDGRDNTQLPTRVSLEQNYPNPFNPTTNIRYSIAETTPVQLIIYDTVGKEVAVLVDKVKNPGMYVVIFDASHLSSGVYLYQLRAGEHVDTKRLVLVK